MFVALIPLFHHQFSLKIDIEPPEEKSEKKLKSDGYTEKEKRLETKRCDSLNSKLLICRFKVTEKNHRNVEELRTNSQKEGKEDCLQ